MVTAGGRASQVSLTQAEREAGESRRILIVADPGRAATSLATRLTLAGYQAAVAPRSLAPTRRSLYSFGPDAVLLQDSEERNSREIFAAVQNLSSSPTIVLGDASETQEVWYLEHGAAQYLVPPISFALLQAHVRAVLRWGSRPRADVIRIGDLEVDASRHQARYRGRTIPLTPTELRLLRTLAENKGSVCSHRMLLERVWGEQFTSCFNYLRLYVGYLRQKLEDSGEPDLIVNEWGRGYRLIDPH
jgi:two-component system KDP operon response regulator KdpE